MLSWDWMTAWWSVYGVPDSGLSLAVWVLDEGGELRAVLPMYRAEEEGRCVVRLISTGEPEEDAVCADYLGPLIAGDHEDVIRKLVSDLVELVQTDRCEVRLTDLTAGESFSERIYKELKSSGLAVRRSAGPVCPYLQLPESYDAFLASLSSNFRAQIRQSEREWKKAGGAVIRWTEKEGDLDPFWRDLVSLHQKRWTGLGRSGVFSSPRFSAFHRKVLRSFFDRGWLVGGVLESQSRPVAAVYGFRCGKTVYFYQSGTDPEIPAKLRAGVLLHANLIRRAIETGEREYDFLRGDDPYKRRFTEKNRSLFYIEAGVQSARLRLRFWRKSARQRLRQIQRRFRK